jgi:hypothetical protein
MRFPQALLLAAAVLFHSSASLANEDGGWITLPFTPVQLAFVPGYGQIFSKPTPVYGVRVTALFGIQSEVVGLDVGAGMQTETLTGVSIGLCSVAEGNATGAQLGLACNQVEADVLGLQVGVVNLIQGKLEGLQLGIANATEEGTGLQIGGLNTATSLRGLQLGVVNVNKNGFLPVFPIFNFGR